jgi:hypothetical protein
VQVWGIFPPEWHLPQLVCLAFCTITKAHLAEILDAKVQACVHMRASNAVFVINPSTCLMAAALRCQDALHL